MSPMGQGSGKGFRVQGLGLGFIGFMRTGPGTCRTVFLSSQPTSHEERSHDVRISPGGFLLDRIVAPSFSDGRQFFHVALRQDQACTERALTKRTILQLKLCTPWMLRQTQLGNHRGGASNTVVQAEPT